MMTCRGSGTLAHIPITFEGKSCPLCNVWQLYQRERETTHNLARKLIDAFKDGQKDKESEIKWESVNKP
jgi:hypothetical protein